MRKSRFTDAQIVEMLKEQGSSVMVHLKPDDGAQLGIPAVMHTDSIIYREEKLGMVDSYSVILEPKMKGRVAMEDSLINLAVFAMIWLQNGMNQPSSDPGNLLGDELGLVMEFLIKHMRAGQFHIFWKGGHLSVAAGSPLPLS